MAGQLPGAKTHTHRHMCVRVDGESFGQYLMPRQAGDRQAGFYLLSFLLIHKYFKAFLTHKAEGAEEEQKKKRKTK